VGFRHLSSTKDLTLEFMNFHFSFLLFFPLHKHCRSCWLSRQSSDFSVSAAGRATALAAVGWMGRNISFHLSHAAPLDSVGGYVSKNDVDEDV